MSIANHPDVNGNITISSSCVQCGGQSDPLQNADYGGPDLSGPVEVVYFYNANRPDNGFFGYGRTLSVNLFLNSSGSTVTLTRGNGNEAKYQDQGGGNFKAQNPGLRNTLFRDDANGLWKESTPDGRVMAYSIAGGQINRLAWVQDSVGNRHTLSYNPDGSPQKVQDAFGRLTTFAYNTSNLLESITDFAGRVTRFAYDTVTVPGKPLLTQVTGPIGCQTRYQYDGLARLTAVIDPNGFRTNYSYDAYNRVVQRDVVGVGSDTYLYQGDQTTWTDALGRRTTLKVNPDSQFMGKTDASGSQTTVSRDDKGQVNGTVDASGGLWKTEYDARGDVISMTDPLGQVTRTERDTYGNPTRIFYPDGTTATMVWGAGGGSNFDTTGAKRRLHKSVDALGNYTSYSYNAQGQLLSVRDALGHVTTNEYDGIGNLIRTTDALGNVTQFAYDAADNLIRTTDALGAASHLTYDAADRLTSTTDPLGRRTQFAYDAAGNMIDTVDALGQRAHIAYNVFGLPVRQADEMGQVTVHEYDAVGQLTATVDALGQRTGIEYDAAGRPTTLIDGNGNRTMQSYNVQGQLVQKIDALGAVESFAYDALGNQTSHTNARGRTTTSSYDAMGRLTGQTLPDGTQIVHNYDASGRLTSLQDSMGTTTYAYDALGRLTGTRDALNHTLAYEYDALGRRTAMTRSDGGLTSYSYDAVGRLTRIFYNPRGEIITYEYDAAGRETRRVLPNSNISVQHFYDVLGRETRKEERSATGALLLMWSTDYDALGNKTHVTELDGSITYYTYDATSQLTREQRIGTHSSNIGYGYDAVGNRLTKTGDGATITTSSYNALNQLVRQQAPDGTVTTFLYDADGNLIQQGQQGGPGKSYTFDDLDQLRVVEVRGAGGALQSRNEFRYDALSRLLVSKATVNGTTKEKRRLFDGLDVVQEGDGTPTGAANVGRDGNIGGIVGRGTLNGDLCFHYDGQGNVVALSDESGTIVARYLYDAFGNLLASSGPRADENPYRFSTKESIGGLVYFGYRFYSPELGRWINRDPIRESGGLNLYGMVNNNPVNSIDLYGLTPRPGGGHIVNNSWGSVLALWDTGETKLGNRVVWQLLVPPGYQTNPKVADIDYAQVPYGMLGRNGGSWIHLFPNQKGKLSTRLWNTSVLSGTRFQCSFTDGIIPGVPVSDDYVPEVFRPDPRSKFSKLRTALEGVDPNTGFPQDMGGPVRTMPLKYAIKIGAIVSIK